MNTKISHLLMVSVALLSASCVHEYPEGEGVDPTNIETTITLKTVPELKASQSPAQPEMPYTNFTVEIYKDSYNDTPIAIKKGTASKAADGSATFTFELPLHAGNYKVAAWATGVMDDSGTGNLFKDDDPANILFNEPYTGSTDRKECYAARFDMQLDDKGWYGKANIEKEMLTPMGGVEIISTDADAFELQLGRNPYGKTTGVDAEANADANPANGFPANRWDDFAIKWVYGMYFPIGYDLYTGLPNKAGSNVSFMSDIATISLSEASLGYDYLFVNGEKATITISLGVYDLTTGQLLNTYSGISATIERGKVTVIRGEFLTTKHGSDIGIDPDFDGNIDIILPD